MTLDERLEALAHNLEWPEVEMADIRREAAARRAVLGRAVVLAEKMDEKITHLSAVQLVTEEKLPAFIHPMRRGGSGNP